MLKVEYDSIYQQIAKGVIIRSNATWYEKGEKSNKYCISYTWKHIKKLKALFAKRLIMKEC